MAVLALVAVTVTVSATQSLGVSSSARASVQGLASAEAGMDVGTVGLRTPGACAAVAGVFTSPAGTTPRYTATVEYKTAAGWNAGCPTATATQVRVTSTGYAQAKGAAGVSAGDEEVVQSVFAYEPVYTNVPIVGSAVYAHTMTGILKSFNLTSEDNSVATSVTIKNGDVTCSNNAVIGGDLIMGNGNADLQKCKVTGKVHINGNLLAENSSDIAKDISVTGNATVRNSVLGGDMRAGGVATSIGNTLTKPGAIVQSGATVAPPQIPEWSDVPSAAAHWSAQGYNVVNWTGPCTIDKTTTQWTNLSSYTHNTVINFMTKCATSPVVTLNNFDTIPLNADLVFLGHEFRFDKLGFASSIERKIAVIVPDDVADLAPTCTPPTGLTGNITLTNETDFSPKVAAMIYTPCKVTSERDGFQGQMYGGEVEFKQQAKLIFKQVGIPGIDLTGGLTEAVKTGMKLGDRLTFRENP
ncbi:hypothetical protein [Homoserinimonas sp. A520]